MRRVAPNIISRIAYSGTVGLVTEKEGKTLASFLYNVLYIPGEEYGLFSADIAFL